MRALFVCLALLVPTASAAADAIDPAPACPPGAQGRSSHSGQWCVPAPCESDGDCTGGDRCRAWRVCSRSVERAFGGRRMFREGEPRTFAVEAVVGSCAPDAACTGLEEPPPPGLGSLPTDAPPPTCRAARYCVSPSLPPLPPPPPAPAAPTDEEEASSGQGAAVRTGGCGCRVAPRAAAPVALPLLALLAMAGRRRR